MTCFWPTTRLTYNPIDPTRTWLDSPVLPCLLFIWYKFWFNVPTPVVLISHVFLFSLNKLDDILFVIVHVIQDLMELLQHFCHPKHPDHPLVFNQDDRNGYYFRGCREQILSPCYSCVECSWFYLHKSCAEIPPRLHHPLHPNHPFILFDEKTHYLEEKGKSTCQVCNKSRAEYTYHCYHCDFNLHIKCGSLLPTLEAEFHDHPLTPIWKWITFTCDLCGIKEDKGMPYLWNPCNFLIHRKCAYLPRRIKVVCHKHPLHITHSSLELHESDSRFCILYVQKVDTRYGLYYCSKCDFIAHLNCAIDKTNREDINLLELKDRENGDEELDQSIESAVAYKVKNINVGEDETEIATKIKHFSHEYDLKLTDEEVHNNKKCNECVRAISPPSYNWAKCSFFLHKSCANLPMKKKQWLHQHRLTLRKALTWCNACYKIVMASSTLLSHAALILMFNVVWSQNSLPTKVISTNSSSPTQALNKVAVVVVIEDI